MLASKIFTFSSTLIGSTNLQPLSKKPAPPSISLSLRARVRCRQQQQTPVPLFVTATPYTDQDDDVYFDNREDNEEEAEAEIEEEEEQGIPGIQVPRQRYISIPKSNLLSAILSSFFPDDSQQQDFIRFSSCLDSILHAEHKTVLEEMRIDYNYSQSQSQSHSHSHSQSQPMNVEETVEDENSPRFDGYRLDLRSFLLGLSLDSNTKTPSPDDLSVAVASRFQSTFLKLLQDAEFEELSVRDLLLTSALNTDYLLTLPINIDWKRASESNAIIFRRGYATEKQKGLLIGEKLDYLQSRLLQGIFFSLSKPLGKVGMLIKEVIESASKRQGVQIWIETVKTRLNELFPQQSNSDDESACDNQLVPGQEPNGNLPIWLAAQKALPRYEGLLSSIGPRGRLLRKLLTWTGLIRSAPKTSLELDNHTTISDIYLRPSFLSRITLGDIWKPATREQCGNDFFKMLKTAVSILFSQSALQEPAFQELILLYNEKEGQRETKDETAVPFMKLKIYERIPIPDLPVVFPHKKLSFRILDTVRLDAASILGLLAFFVNYKFEDIRSSPSAVLLDVIAATALIIYLTRLVLGYKQTWDRYQLLVNRTLYEKTLASGFGSVHFLLDASEQQQYKEAILAYAVLLGAKEGQVTSSKFIGDACEKFMYSNFKEKVKMPVDKAVNTLLRLGLVTRIPIDGNIKLQALPCSEGYEALKRHWDLLLV